MPSGSSRSERTFKVSRTDSRRTCWQRIRPTSWCLDPWSRLGHERCMDDSCGYCRKCVARKKAKWIGRLFVECLEADRTYFSTLTYRDVSAGVSYKDVQKWLDCLRARFGRFRHSCVLKRGSSGLTSLKVRANRRFCDFWRIARPGRCPAGIRRNCGMAWI